MKPTVLIVDDDLSLLDALGRSLRAAPYKVVTVADARRALEHLDAESIAVLITDDQMPGMGGVELLAQVRRHHPQVIPILMSGRATIGGLAHAINDGGVFRFLIKPCFAQEVDACIRLALAQYYVFERCRRLLPLVRRQSAILATMERLDPGLLHRAENEAAGGITVSPADFTDMDSLAERIDIAIRSVEGVLPSSSPTIGESGMNP